jgi:excisionase family DNA binding protein
MLLHEWLQYRDRHIRRLRAQMEEKDAAARPEERGVAQALAEASSSPQAQPSEGAAEAAPSAPPKPVASTPHPAQPSARRAAADKSRPPAPTPAAQRPIPKTARDVLQSLQPTQDVRTRLEMVLARQRRLPLEELGDTAARRGRRRVVETREQLVSRLLDPQLTLQETALLLGVCPTTVRRYTNRGILKCFRTPGNQRRFRLSDVLEFMERREQSEDLSPDT